MAAHLDPDVVAAAGGHDREAVAASGRTFIELVLDGAELTQRAEGVGSQELREHPFHRTETEALA